MVFTLVRRQFYGDNGDDGDYWGYSTTAVAIKWAFVGAILALFLLWFVGGYYHAQRRIKRGLPPLMYHRFLLPHRQRMMYRPRSQHFYPPQNGYGEGYPMQNYAAPPPAYHAEHIPPPVYQPPEGGSKVNPTQDWAVPPAGPPPGPAEAGGPSTAMQGVPLGPEPTGQAQVASESAVQGKKPGRLSRLNLFQRG